jgi:hypothetical protein
MQSGRLRKLFLDKFNVESEDEHANLLGMSPSDKLCPLRSSCDNERMESKELMVLEFLGDIHDEDGPLHPDKYTLSRSLRPPNEGGNFLIAVPFAERFFKAVILIKLLSSSNKITRSSKEVSKQFKLDKQQQAVIK